MNGLPRELHWEALQWLEPSADTADKRRVCKHWDQFIKHHVTACCVHQYHAKRMKCRVAFVGRNDTVSDVLRKCPASDGCTAYYFPHCLPEVYPCPTGFSALQNPDPETVSSYNPTALHPQTKVKDLLLHRLLISDRCESDRFFNSAQESFSSYMRLLLRFQVKHQEYTFEHQSRMRLLRTYVYNLENRVSCKLRLLLEHIGYLCIRYMVQLLPYLEKSIKLHDPAITSGVKQQLVRYQHMQAQIDRERAIVESGYHIPVADFEMPDLEAYASFLCSADDSLEAHVDRCRVQQPHLALPASKLPGCCRLGESGKGGNDEGKEEEKEEEEELKDTTPPLVEVLLQAVVTLCATQRDFERRVEKEKPAPCSNIPSACSGPLAPDTREVGVG